MTSAGCGGYSLGQPVEATMVRSFPVRLVEVSRCGCLVECSSKLDSGTSGLLTVELAGSKRVDHFRVVRRQERLGAGEVYQLGAEWLRTRRLSRRTVRMAVAAIVNRDREGDRARGLVENPPAAQSEVGGRSAGRSAPPPS
jgi:hypothetical protein